MANFNNLYADIILTICEFIPIEDILALRRYNKQLYSIDYNRGKRQLININPSLLVEIYSKNYIKYYSENALKIVERCLHFSNVYV